jgi:hypothetical protein
MKTEFGIRPRPHFEVIDFRSMGGGPALSGPQTPQLPKPGVVVGKPVAPVSTEEALDDSLPF